MKRTLSIALAVVLLTSVLGGAAAMPVAADETDSEDEGDEINVEDLIDDILSDNDIDSDVVVSDVLDLEDLLGEDSEENGDEEESDSLLGLL